MVLLQTIYQFNCGSHLCMQSSVISAPLGLESSSGSSAVSDDGCLDVPHPDCVAEGNPRPRRKRKHRRPMRNVVAANVSGSDVVSSFQIEIAPILKRCHAPATGGAGGPARVHSK